MAFTHSEDITAKTFREQFHAAFTACTVLHFITGPFLLALLTLQGDLQEVTIGTFFLTY